MFALFLMSIAGCATSDGEPQVPRSDVVAYRDSTGTAFGDPGALESLRGLEADAARTPGIAATTSSAKTGGLAPTWYGDQVFEIEGGSTCSVSGCSPGASGGATACGITCSGSTSSCSCGGLGGGASCSC